MRHNIAYKFEEDIPDPIEFSEEICEAKRRLADQAAEVDDFGDSEAMEFEI